MPEIIKIGELSRRSGVPVSTLRTWERRYGFPRAERSAGGQRRYPESEVQRVLEARRVVEAGWPIRLAVRRSDEPDPAQRSAAALEVTADLGVRALSGTPFRPLGRDAVRNDEGTGSAVLAPLVKKGACLGIIALYRNDPYSLHADALGAVQCVANVLAAAETTPGTRGT